MKTITFGSPEYLEIKKEILSEYGVISSLEFNPKPAIRQRIDYLKEQIKSTGQKGFVLGISGGVDSTTTGKLCQLAVNELRQEGVDAKFIAMRLPSGIQLDEDHAQEAIKFIRPDLCLTVNIAEAANNISNQGVSEFQKYSGSLTPEQIDFNKGNIKARLRMLAQYQVASMYGALVIGTDHNSEAVTGFFTKYGDGGCDLIVLNGLNKTQVRMVAKELGAPQILWEKFPTADLEELNPQKHDQDGFGFEYSLLDLFLEGKQIDPIIETKIIQQYKNTQHKRKPIPVFKPVSH